MPSNWPSTLPQAPGGYSQKDAKNTIRTQNDSGPAKYRRRFTKALTTAQMEFLLTIAQVATLETFFKTTLKDGSLSMNFVHPWTGVTKEMFITEPPSYTNEGPLAVRASFPVEFY